MSEILEREGGASVFVSTMGAWLGLGAGLALLTLSLLAVLNSVYRQDAVSEPPTTVRIWLSRDLVSARTDTLAISDNGKRLDFSRTESAAVEEARVAYYLEKKRLIREDVDTRERRVLGPFSLFKFERTGNRLSASWSGPTGSDRQVWALSRWGDGE